MNDRILVFIPCYNCAPQIGRVLRRLAGPVAAHIAEVLVLDNGSSDGTVEAAIAAAGEVGVPSVVAGRNRANYNLGGSHKAAYAYAERAGFSHVVTLHGDDQGDITDILPVLENGAHRRADAQMGSRFMPHARSQGYSPIRIAGNHVFNAIFSIAALRPVHDLGSGLNILARTAFADPALLRLPDGLEFNAYLLLDMIGRDHRVDFFPISWREDDQVSNVKMASQALSILGAAVDYRLRRGHFRTHDYRRVRHASYVFDEVARFTNGQLRQRAI